ncbi:DEAD/DEAH box helicase [Planctomycetales bacterium 10988]|nr:DEAD/DEAH box helicase [Planctomycetales bacterium 10988]
MTEGGFPTLAFQGSLRPSQESVVNLAKKRIEAGQRQLHIVAPPGTGKTILGLYLWAHLFRCPAVVLSPNSAIQAQWIDRAELFLPKDTESSFFSMQPKEPRLLTSLTYQSVTMPRRRDEDLDKEAIAHWQESLIEKEQAESWEEAKSWIEDLRIKNEEYFEERLATYRKEAREQKVQGGDMLEMLHTSSRNTFERLRNHGVQLLLLDECHHLMGHWGRVLADAREYLDDPIIIGLTATPPETAGQNKELDGIYQELLGPIDVEIPIPAVVKDGFLAPYQELAYFVRPTAEEMTFIAQAETKLDSLVDELCKKNVAKDEKTKPLNPRLPLEAWVFKVLKERKIWRKEATDWETFEQRSPEFAWAARVFLLQRRKELPQGVPQPQLDGPLMDMNRMEWSVPVLDEYVRNYLRRSASEEHHDLAEEIIARLRIFGIQITETGARACASPVSRVLAYSQNKAQALIPILQKEKEELGERIRAVVVADFEKSSALAAEIEDVMDREAGGAMAAFRTLLSDPKTNELDPILVTGSSLLVDDDLTDQFLEAGRKWLEVMEVQVELNKLKADEFHVIRGSGSDWSPKVYVAMVTEFFQTGLTKCLVGTRGLLGEGWDASRTNVLLDLTTVTTSMSINQLRGRSIRLDTLDEQKLANNWDIVCISPEFARGLDDFSRFIKKHDALYGVTEEGLVERGVGHVHEMFRELTPENLEESIGVINSEMLARIHRREDARKRWKIGEPYEGTPTRVVDLKIAEHAASQGWPPFSNRKELWSDESLALDIAQAILGAMREANLITETFRLQHQLRGKKGVRVFLKNAQPEEMELFAEAMREAMGPLENPKYVIPRQVDQEQPSWFSWLLPSIIKQYVSRRERKLAMLHAVPTIFCESKETVALFERHWQKSVSPGQATYTYHGKGQQLVKEAKKSNQVPFNHVQLSELFT